MKHNYRKEIKWSEADGCFIGRCPDLFLGGCHGDDAAEVGRELEGLIDEVLEDYAARGASPPPAQVRKARVSSALLAREKSGMTQMRFSRAIGVGVGTLRNWEQGRVEPKGAAAKLVSLLARHPDLVEEIAKEDPLG